MDIVETFNEYLNQSDWRVKENSNSQYCFGGLNKYLLGKASALYWEELYNKENPEIIKGHRNGDYHIHDLGSFSSYCFGGSLQELLLKGIVGVKNISVSAPAKRLQAVTAQISNIVTIFQNEIAGAVAFSSWNVYLAPFVYFDTLKKRGIKISTVKEKLEYTDEDINSIRQSVEGMVYQLNSNSRMGSEPAFSNLTLDFNVLTPMVNKPVIYGGQFLEGLTYGQFQEEADLLLKIFSEVMLKGDYEGKPFAYPIPTFNIGKNVNWDKHDCVYELAAKNGSPYFGNFIHGNLQEEDVYSMCCRLRLNKKELINKTGGLFGAGEKTGSLGVFTINLPAIGYRNTTEELFFSDLRKQMELGYEQLLIKKKVIDSHLEEGLFPALKEYLGSTRTLFLTIGLVGGHEMCVNFLGSGIETKVGKDFTIKVIHFMRDILSEFQEKSGLLFNLEYTPAESTAYRLAMKDRKRYSNIFTSGEDEPYYTNSTHLPVGLDLSFKEIYEHQNGLLSLATGGSVYHNYLDGSITKEAVKHFLKVAFTNYDLPYISFSPVYSICKDHGFLSGHHDKCPHCNAEVTVYQRITGYVRPIENFNKGKLEEYKQRIQRKGDI